MDFTEKEIIFSMSFPKTNEDKLDENAQKICETDPEVTSFVTSSTFEKILDNLFQRYTYIPRKEAERQSKEFISCAIEICQFYEIDTEISRMMHSIVVSMNIGFGWIGGHIKRDLDELISLADDISLFGQKDDPDALIMVLSYYTHDRVANK